MTDVRRPTGERVESADKNAADQKAEAQIAEILQRARQNVKSQMKAEIAGEVISGDLLNFRLRSCR
jgi:hypothetical protein